MFQVIFTYLPSVGYQFVVHQFGRTVEDGAEEGGVYLGAYFIGSFQASYVSVVEFQPAVQIGIEGRGGEERLGTSVDVVGIEHLLQHLRCLVNLNFPGLLGGLSGFKVLKGDVVWRFYQELQHEAGHFPAVQSVRRGVI